MLNKVERQCDAAYYGVREGVDNTQALQLALAATGEIGVELVLPPHDMIITEPLRYYYSNALLRGHGRYSRIIAKGGGYTALTVGPGEGNNGIGNERGGYLKHFVIDAGPTAPNDMTAGLKLDNIRFLRVEGIQVEGFHFGFDLVNNCFGTSFHDIRTIFGGCRVGMIQRGQKDGKWGSGSDIPVFNGWMAGTEAAYWINPGGGGYNFFGGQMGMGYGLTENRDDLGCIVIGKDYETGQIGGSGIVSIRGMDFEGWKRAFAIRGYGRCQVSVSNVSFLATDREQRALGVLKVTDGENGLWAITNCAYDGQYLEKDLLSLQSSGSAFAYHEYNNLAGYNAYAAGVQIKAGTSLSEQSKTGYGLYSGRRAGKPYVGIGATQIRGEAGALQVSFDFGETFRTIPSQKQGEGEPKFSANCIGEEYVDTLNRKVYKAVSVNNWVTVDGVKKLNDWVAMN
jgi:hypothetical protein